MAIIVIGIAGNNTGHQPGISIKAYLVFISIEILLFFMPFAILVYHYLKLTKFNSLLLSYLGGILIPRTLTPLCLCLSFPKLTSATR